MPRSHLPQSAPALAAGCAALTLAAPAALAQNQDAPRTEGGIQEVTITAERRETSLQETPIAVSALSAESLQDRGITDFEGVAKASPSIAFTPYPSSSNTLILYLRGQGVADAGQITLDSAVGLYQDGFYISRAQMVTFDLADIERVEVLRGPQGTLYGRNTTGGAVNLISRKPSGEWDFRQEFTVGKNNRFRSLSVLDTGRLGGLSAKLSFLTREQDGYVDNPGRALDFGEEDQTAGRIALRWDTDGAFTADYFFETGSLDSTPVYYVNPALAFLIPGYELGEPPDEAYRPFDLNESEGNFDGHGLTLTWEVSDALTLRSLTGYRDVDTEYFQDYAEVFFAGFRSFDDIRYHQFSQELQALGSLLDGRLEYVTGLYYFEESGRHFENVTITNLPGADPLLLSKDRDVDAESESQAAFAQFTWTPPVLGDRLALTFGARYTKDERSASRSLLNTFFGFPVAQEPAPGLVTTNDVESSQFNPAFTANYSWTDDVSTYLRIATGYKAGGSSESVDVGQFGRTFEPEDVIVYELGLKSYLFDRRVRLNAAVFDSQYDDMQLFFNTNPGDLSIVAAINAGEASVSGLELEALWQPTESLSFTLDYTYLDASYDEVIAPAGTIFDPASNPASPYQVGQDVKDVFVMPYAPENSVNLGANWTFLEYGSGSVSAILNYRWEDRSYFTTPAGEAVPNRELYSRPSFGLFDARLSWQIERGEDSRVRIDLWGKNLGNREWPAHLIGLGGSIPVQDFFGTTPAGFVAQGVAWAERPVYGVNLVYDF